MKYILMLMLLVLSACASVPQNEAEYDESVKKAKYCAYDTLRILMGDIKATEYYCSEGPDKEGL